MKKIISWVILFAAVFSYGQESSDSLFMPRKSDGASPVTLQAALETALKNNTKIKDAVKTRDIYRAQIEEYKSYIYPSLSFTGSYLRNVEKPAFIIGGNRVMVGQNNVYSAGLDANWVLWSGGQVKAGVKIAQKVELTGEYNLRSVRDEIEKQVKDMAYMIILSNAVAKVQEGRLNIARQNLKEMHLKYKQGLSSNLDVMAQEVSVSNIEPLVIQADNNYEVGTLYLKRLLNKDPEDKIYLTWDNNFVIKEPQKLEELYLLAEKHRPDLMLSQMAMEIAAEQIAVARAGHYPVLSIYGTKYYNGQTENGLPGNDDYYWTATAGVRVNMPLFSGFKITSQVRQKRLLYEQARQDFEDMQRAIRISIKTAWLNFYEARKRMSGGDTVIKQSRQNLEALQKRYRSGLASRLELDDAAVALTNAQLQYVTAVHDALTALADLKFTVGTEVER